VLIDNQPLNFEKLRRGHLRDPHGEKRFVTAALHALWDCGLVRATHP
jgi:hypothetical protein